MDKDWLKYWQKVEGLETEDDVVEEGNSSIENAKELYKSIVGEEN